VARWRVVFRLLETAMTDDSHPFSVHDMLAMDRIGEPQVSPDGRRIAFTRRVTDLEANKGRADLWVVNVEGGGLRRLTTHPAGCSNPRWAPDGTAVYFISARNGGSQVWRIPADGGEAEQVTHLPLDVGCFAISRDGRFLAVSMDVFVDATTLEETKKRLEEIGKRKASGRIYERLFVRHWDAWKDGRRAHLFVLPLDQEVQSSSLASQGAQNSASGRQPVDVTKGMDADVPSKPHGGAEEFTFAPDGREIVFSACNVGREEAWSTQFDLYAAPIDGSAAPRLLTPGNQAIITRPVFSPDGKTLAYLAMQRPNYEADRQRIVIREWAEAGRRGGQGNTGSDKCKKEGAVPRVLTETWDRSPAEIAWSPDGGTIYACADNLGQHSLFAIQVGTGEVRAVLLEGHITDVTPAGSRLVLGLQHLRQPKELYSVDPDGSDLRPITKINAAKLAAARMGEPEQFTFKGWNDETVYYQVVRPVDFDPERKYPVAFLIHGGPQGSFANEFHYRWNPQAYAGAGYAAVMVDFHGSTGYGQAFTDSISNHWGDRPLEDLQKGLDAALARYPWMDGQRAAALGASYGGYMINWLHGVWPGRFRCLVCHDGNIDERMAYYDTEELWFPEWEHGGLPWERPEGYARHNPIDHVQNWQTPTLVIHGGKDFRVVDTQGLSTFTVLQRRGVPSKLLYFPDENHWVLKPHNSILWHETVIGWLDQWCR
jgi:dipeptidyl aminopeptidase/acylaminoacyl peptidase